MAEDHRFCSAVLVAHFPQRLVKCSCIASIAELIFKPSARRGLPREASCEDPDATVSITILNCKHVEAKHSACPIHSTQTWLC